MRIPGTTNVSDTITPIMFMLFPIGLMLLTAITVISLRFIRPNFKYPWVLAVGGATLTLFGIFLWHIRLPINISLARWQPVSVFLISPSLLADRYSWVYAVSLSALAAAVIWTSVVRDENDPASWAGILLITALGILAVTAGNFLTIVLVWCAIDLAELFTMLRSTEGEEHLQGVVIAFSTRAIGTGLVIWAALVGVEGGIIPDFLSIPRSAGIFLLTAVGLRLGVLPLHLPYLKENVLRRGFGTTLRLVSAAASLSLLARIPPNTLSTSLSPLLLFLGAIAALYSGWMWLRASDEILGRPFWVLGLASMSVCSSLRGNPAGSVGWGVILILAGGSLFLFSARQRSILWLPLLNLWGMSTLPYSITSSAWSTGNQSPWLSVIFFLPAQALLMTGFVRHTLHPGKTSLESEERWTKYLYPIGLILLAGITLLFGFWGWEGAGSLGQLWPAITVTILTAVLISLALTILPRLKSTTTPSQWTRIFHIKWLYKTISMGYDFFCRIADIFTSTLEGEGGLFWSLLLLALILSVLSSRGL